MMKFHTSQVAPLLLLTLAAVSLQATAESTIPRLELQTSGQIGAKPVRNSAAHGKAADPTPLPALEVSGTLVLPESVKADQGSTPAAVIPPTVQPAVVDGKVSAKAQAKAEREAKKQAEAQAKAEARAARDAQRQADAQAKAEAQAQAAANEQSRVQAQAESKFLATESKKSAESKYDETPSREKLEADAKKARGSANYKAKVAAELQAQADEKEKAALRAQSRAEEQADAAAKARAEAKTAARDAAEAKVKAADATKVVADLEAKAASEALSNVGAGAGASAQTEAEIASAREQAKSADATARSRAALAVKAKTEADAQVEAAEHARSRAESQAKAAASASEEAQRAAQDLAVAKAREAAAAQAIADFEHKSAADAIAKAQAKAQAAADAKAKAEADVLAAKSGTKPKVDPGMAVKSAVAARLALPVITEPYTAIKTRDSLRVAGWELSIIGVSRPGNRLVSRGAGDQAATAGEWVVVFLELRNASDSPQSILDYNFQFVSGGSAAGCQNPAAGGCRYFISGLSEARGLYQESRGLTILHNNYDKKEFAPGAMARTALVFDLPVNGASLKFGIGDSYVDLGTLRNVPVTPAAAK